MKPITISLLTISFLLFSCGNTNKESNKQTEVLLQEEHHHNDEKESIKLNNGEKWFVNDEMKPHIHEAEEILMEYEKNKPEEYRELAVILKEKNSALIKSCTMKGESHDQLHKWLHPHIELIDNLGKANNLTEANETISQLKKSFETYKNYFQ